MGRSGSSALTRVLSLCGGRLPDGLLPPNRWNSTGYWEPEAAVHANARFLQAIGSSFFDTRLESAASPCEPRGRQFIGELASFLRECRADDGPAPLILKEPRISLLLPFWLAALKEAGFSPRIVIPVRDPTEVADSLGRWKGLPAGHTCELWLKYNLLAERQTRHLPRAFVSYTDLLEDWRREIRSISKALEVPLPLNGEVDEFLDPQLCHATRANEASRSGIPWLPEVHDALLGACRGGELDAGLLDSAFRDINDAQVRGSRHVVSAFGTDFGAV